MEHNENKGTVLCECVRCLELKKPSEMNGSKYCKTCYPLVYPSLGEGTNREYWQQERNNPHYQRAMRDAGRGHLL